MYQPVDADFDVPALTRMTHVLEHRGPDDFGFCAPTDGGIAAWKLSHPVVGLAPGAAMGHRRLSILDLSDAGRQPFISADDRFALVYNGEVYNYKELRAELEASGVTFKTHTDTEVVLAAYVRWGTACFSRFNGMWGLVIWDRLENTLVACRDHFGIKPLYFYRTPKGWIFASEVKAILAHPSVSSGVDEGALLAYLMDVDHPRDGRTFYAGIRCVEPASYIVVTPSTVKAQTFWRLPEGTSSAIRGIDETANCLEELLRDSVALRMRSDVRIGTMLSGGLDSTSVISMVRRLMESSGVDLAATGDVLQAFTAIYHDSPIGEEHLVDELCTSLGVRANKVFPMREDELESLLYKAAWHMEGPFFNSVPMVHTLLMRRAKSVGVKVVLNGHGPDEMFAGYPASYIPEAIGDAIAGFRWGEALREINAMRDVHGLGRRRSLLRALATRAPRWLRERQRRAALANSPLMRATSRALLARDAMDADGGSSRGGALSRALREDFFHRSLPNWLYLEDRISMSESIEARLPFLDPRIVEFAFSLPNQFKIAGATTKRVLREAMKNHLPQSIASNTRKIPFSGPDTVWIQGPLRPWVERTFLKQDARLFEYLEPEAVRATMRSFLDPTSPSTRVHPYRVWKFVNTELWLQTYFNASKSAAAAFR